jgi:hypothetical protein
MGLHPCQPLLFLAHNTASQQAASWFSRSLSFLIYVA